MHSVLAAALLSLAVADPIPHSKFEVTSLPGWANTDGTPKALPSRQFT